MGRAEVISEMRSLREGGQGGGGINDANNRYFNNLDISCNHAVTGYCVMKNTL
jgi:hypothetical protein